MGGAHDLPVQHHRRDHIAAKTVLGAVFPQARRRTLAPVAEAEVMTHHDVADLQVPDQVLQEIPPIHLHDAAVEVDEDHVFNAVAAADDLLPADGAVDQGDLFAKDQGVRVHVKAQHRGHGMQFGRPLLGSLEQFAVADMDAVEKAQGNDSLCLFH